MAEKTFEQLTQDVQLTRESYLSAQQRASLARNEETDALNRLNQAQKALDARIDTIRKGAPRDSHWNQQRAPGFPVSG